MIEELRQLVKREPREDVLPLDELIQLAGKVTQLEKEFAVSSRDELFTHLTEHPKLVERLLATAAEIRAAFERAKVVLTARDGDLEVIIETDLDVPDAERRFARVLKWCASNIKVEDHVVARLRYL